MVAQYLERRPQDPMDSMTGGSNPVKEQHQNKIVSVFSSQKWCADSCSVCPIPRVCIRTHENNHVRTLKILLSMSELGGLLKHEETQHALVGLGIAALAAAVALPRRC